MNIGAILNMLCHAPSCSLVSHTMSLWLLSYGLLAQRPPAENPTILRGALVACSRKVAAGICWFCAAGQESHLNCYDIMNVILADSLEGAGFCSSAASFKQDTIPLHIRYSLSMPNNVGSLVCLVTTVLQTIHDFPAEWEAFG